MSTPTKSTKGKLSTDNTNNGLLGLSASEAKVLLLGVAYPTDAGKPDYDKLAEKGNYKNASSVRTIYGNARRKLERALAESDAAVTAGETGATCLKNDDGDNTATTTASPSTPAKTPRGKGRPPKTKQTASAQDTASSSALTAAGDDNAAVAETTPPTKPARGRDRRKTKQSASDEEDAAIKVVIEPRIKAEDDDDAAVKPEEDETMAGIETAESDNEPLFPGVSAQSERD